MSKYIRWEDLEVAILAGGVPRKDVPGYDYQQLDRLEIERRFPIVKELELESESDVTLKFLNGPVQQLFGVVRIVHIERQQPSLEPCADELAGDSPELVTVVEKRLNAGHRPGEGGNEQWERFCDHVRKDCGKKATDRGYGDRTIKRVVKLLKDK